MIKIWQRYFLFQFIRMFFLFLCCFYGLYVLIDYASHTSNSLHHHAQVSWKDIVLFYSYVFANRAEILLPLAVLIAFVHTLCSLNTHHELVAFMASGFSIKKLLQPFVGMGLFFVCLLYLNEQFILPDALQKMRKLEEMTKHKKKKQYSEMAANHINLEDGSIFIYQDYNANTNRFFDAYWIQSIDSIYRIKILSLSPTPTGTIPAKKEESVETSQPASPPFLAGTATPTGYFVDHLVRGSNGEILQEKSFVQMSFPNIQFPPNLIQTTLSDPTTHSIEKLYIQSLDISDPINEQDSKILTSLYWKLMMPWLALLAIIAPAPFCVRFSRSLPIFLIYVCSLFGLIAFFMFMDAAQVIAKRQVLSPFLAICSPFFIAFSYFGWRFARLN